MAPDLQKMPANSACKAGVRNKTTQRRTDAAERVGTLSNWKDGTANIYKCLDDHLA